MTKDKIYTMLPIWAQNLACDWYSRKMGKLRYGGDYEEIFSQLVDDDSWSAEQIQSYKEDNLARILEYSYKHCPYYHERYKKAGLTPSDFKCIDDLKKFPILKKEDVRENLHGLISDEYDFKKLIHYHTSGSTGKALDFCWTPNNMRYYWAIGWRHLHRFGLNRGDRQLSFTGKPVCPIGQKKPPYWRRNKSVNQYIINMQHITAEKIRDIVGFINSKDFKFIVGYPSNIAQLASLAVNEGFAIDRRGLYIIPSAEKLYDYQKAIITEAFPDVRIRPHYGFSEEAAAASTCDHGVYHEDWELGHLELLDPVVNGCLSTGRMLATGFQNLGMPFIRYEMGDTATFSSEKCTCGIQGQVIIDIEGRNEDYIITPEGNRIMRWSLIFQNTPDIKEAQIVQKKLGEVIIRIVRRANYSSKTEALLMKEIREKISQTIDVRFEYLDEIPRTASGKFKGVISEINSHL